MNALHIRRENVQADREPEPLDGGGLVRLLAYLVLLFAVLGPWVLEWLR